MKKFLINIKTDKKRLTRSLGELEKVGINDCEIFNAIIDENPRLGISKSFRTIIKENYNEPYILVFEDDIKFCDSESYNILMDTLNKLPHNWDVLLGGSYQHELDYKTKGFLKVGDFSSLHCTVFRNSCYDILLSHDLSVKENIDKWLGKFSKEKKLNVFLCDPQVAIQYPGYSHQVKKDVDYTHRLKGMNILNENTCKISN